MHHLDIVDNQLKDLVGEGWEILVGGNPVLLLLVLVSFDVSLIVSLSSELSFRSTLIIDAICKFALHLIYLLVNSDYVYSTARFLRLHAAHIAFTAITEVASSLLFQTVVESIIIQ